MKMICTICCESWDTSKYNSQSTYICPWCQWKINHNEKIILGRRRRSWKKPVSLVSTI